MMRALDIFIISVSGLCLSYSLPFPVQDTSLSGYNYLQYDDVDKPASSDVADLPGHELSRLGRLIGSYTNLLLAGPKSSGHEDLRSKDKQSDSVGFQGSDWSWDSSKNSVPSYMNNGFWQLDDQRPKRQQGWYVQYGKRSEANFLHPDPSQVMEPRGLTLDSIAYTQKALPLLLTTTLDGEPGTPMLDYSSLLPRDAIDPDAIDDIGSASRASIEANGNSGLNVKVSKRALSRQVPKTKRQQGWYTPYGKRSVSDHYPRVL
ncbi:hypothetical protein BsWGS_08318 [Bradybaena similaris]